MAKRAIDITDKEIYECIDTIRKSTDEESFKTLTEFCEQYRKNWKTKKTRPKRTENKEYYNTNSRKWWAANKEKIAEKRRLKRELNRTQQKKIIRPMKKG